MDSGLPESTPISLLIARKNDNESTSTIPKPPKRQKRVRFDSSANDNTKEDSKDSNSKTLLKRIKKLNPLPPSSTTPEVRKWDDHKKEKMKTGKYTPEELETLKNAI